MNGKVPDADRIERWRAAWPQALAQWSRYTRLRDPRLCERQVEAAAEGLSGSFAMIRLDDQSVVVDLETTARLQLDDYALEILAHEVGHHVLVPGNTTDHYRLLARVRKALSTLKRHAPLVANLYADLYINDRLQRQRGLRMDAIYRALAQSRDPAAKPGRVWALYMGIYEQLWRLDKGSLGGPVDDPALEADAWLGARVVRVYAGDWLVAAGRFASLLLPNLVDDVDESLGLLHDTRTAAEGAEPYGALEAEGDEADGAIHPAEDPRITGREAAPGAPADVPEAGGPKGGQMRGPFEYGELLRAAGIRLDDHEIAVRYYRERALPHLVRFPVQPRLDSSEPQMEGLEPWELGDALDEIDWLQTLSQSPHVVPGVTTVRRVYGREPAREQDMVPVDLDIYVDSSGSMPDPQQQLSYLALAGAVIALSALRTGARVQATLWSGKDQFVHTDGFVRNEDAILRVLTGSFGGATAFPIHRLRDTYAQRGRDARPAHVLMISDDGITTMFDDDERGVDGWKVAADALARAGGGGTMALNIPRDWLQPTREGTDGDWRDRIAETLQRAKAEQGWQIHAIERMDDLLEFARAFSRRHAALASAAISGALP